MGRLSKHLNRASNAMDDLEMSVARNVDKLVERVQAVNVRQEDAFMRKHVELDGHVADVAEFEKDIEEFDRKNSSGAGENSSADKLASLDGTPYSPKLA